MPLTTVAGEPPRGRPPPTPRHAAPTGHAGQGNRGGPPHPHARATARGWRTPTDRSVGGQSGEGERLTLGAPHNGGRHPLRGRPSTTPTASNACPQGSTLWGQCWVPTPASTAPGTHGSRNPGCPPQETGGRGRDSVRHQTPLTMVAGHPPPGKAPHHPRGTQPPQGMQARGTVLGPYTHTPAPTARGWRTPTARSVGGQLGEGARLTSDAPHNGERHPPPGTPFCHPHSEQCRPAGAHAVGPVVGPHARTDRIRDTRVAERGPPAPEDGRPGEGQRLTPDAPHNSGRPPPPGDGPPPPPRHAAPTGHASQAR